MPLIAQRVGLRLGYSSNGLTLGLALTHQIQLKASKRLSMENAGTGTTTPCYFSINCMRLVEEGRRQGEEAQGKGTGNKCIYIIYQCMHLDRTTNNFSLSNKLQECT